MQHYAVAIIIVIENSADPDEMQHYTIAIIIVIENSADPDEMQHYAAFHQGLHRLFKIQILRFPV